MVLFDDKIGEYSVANVTYVSDRYFTDIGCGELTSFASLLTCMHFGGVFIPLRKVYPDKTCVRNDEKVYIMDGRMEIIDELEYEDIYRLYRIGGEYMFMANGMVVVVTDSEGIEVARFECGPQAFVAGDFMYEIKDNILLEIDISGFLPRGNDCMQTDATVTEMVDISAGDHM